MTILKAALGLAASAYVKDRVMRPKAMGQIARRAADRSGKPLLLIHDSGAIHHLFGAPVETKFSTNVAYPIPVADKSFGALLAVGILERVKRPEVALAEWNRISDRVYVVVPSWWSPHAWIDPGVRWLIDPSLDRATPLWTSACRSRLLNVSDSRYGTRQCVQTTSAAPPLPSPMSRRHRAMEQRAPSRAQQAEAPTMPAEESAPYPFLEDRGSPTPSPSEGSPKSLPSDSWSFAKDLMVISSEGFDES